MVVHTLMTMREPVNQWKLLQTLRFGESMHDLIKRNRRLTLLELTVKFGCSKGLAFTIVHDRHEFRKVCAQTRISEFDSGWDKCINDRGDYVEKYELNLAVK